MSLKSVGTFKETTIVELLDPRSGEPMTHEGKKLFVEVYGPYSQHYKSIVNAQQNSRLMKAQRTGGKMNVTAEQIQATTLNTLVKCVKSWLVVADPEEGPIDCTEENVRDVFEKYPWVRSQVEDAQNDDKAFLDSSQTN